MNPITRSLLLLVLAVSTFPFCNQHRRVPVKTPIVCTDTAKHAFTLDTITGYKLKAEAKLNILLNIEWFNTQEDFDKYFMLSPTDSSHSTLNFKDNLVIGILIDNKTPNPRSLREIIKLETQLFIDSAYTQQCRLIIPFLLTARETDHPFQPGSERKYVLFSIPRSTQVNEVYVWNKSGGLSRGLPIPAAE